MERNQISAVSLLHTYSAADVATSGNVTKITGLPPIVTPGMRVVEVTADTGVAETVQVLTLTLAATVAQDTNYSIRMNFIDDAYEGHTSENVRIAYHSPNVLSGSVSGDKHNVYASLAAKINNIARLSKKVTAAAVFTVVTSAGTGTYNVGDIVSANSGVNKGKVLISVTGATPTLTLAVIPGYGTSFTGAITSTSTSGGTGAGTAGAITLGVGLTLTDVAGYYPVNSTGRGGATLVYANEGFVTADIAYTTAAVYAKWTAAQITSMVPTKDLLNSNVILGNVNFSNLNNQPTAAAVYNALTIKVRTRGSARPIDDATGAQTDNHITYLLLLNAADGDYAATLAAVQALVAVA